jgi:hypothetical protein
MRRALKWLATAILIAASAPAFAAPCTVGTSPIVCLAAKTTHPYRLMVVDNESTTATIACTDDGTTPAINTAGSYTMPLGTTRTWSAANVEFIGPLTCIASGAATPVTVKGQ